MRRTNWLFLLLLCLVLSGCRERQAVYESPNKESIHQAFFPEAVEEEYPTETEEESEDSVVTPFVPFS